MDYYSLCTVVETPEFIRQTRKYLLEVERDELIGYLAADPLAGVLLKGSGGLRKIRWAYDRRGKSGGLRVIYLYYSYRRPVYALTAYAKSDKDALSTSELQKLNELCHRLKKSCGAYDV